MNRGLLMVRDRLMVCHPAMIRPTTTARRMITVCRHGRRAQFHMLLRRYVQRVIFGGDVVPGPVAGAGCAIRRYTRDPTAATVRAFMTLIEIT